MGLRALLFGLAIGCTVTQTAAAAERPSCLSPEERRAVIAARKAVPLAHAMHVVKARLCRQDNSLVYVLTVLSGSGKVLQARVDAANGNWLGGS